MIVRAHWISGLIAALMLWASAGAVLADPLDDAWAAYQREDLAAAGAIVEPLAATGDPDAKYLLSVLLYHSQYEGADPARATVVRREAAEAGVVMAQLSATALIATPPQETRDWWLRAARQGSTFAMWALSKLYEDGERNYVGRPDLAPDPAEAWYWSWVEYYVRTEAARIAALANPTPAEVEWLSVHDRVNDIEPGAERVISRVSPPPEGLGIIDQINVHRRASEFRVRLERRPRRSMIRFPGIHAPS